MGIVSILVGSVRGNLLYLLLEMIDLEIDFFIGLFERKIGKID